MTSLRSGGSHNLREPSWASQYWDFEGEMGLVQTLGKSWHIGGEGEITGALRAQVARRRPA